jgi:hypothetical protein
MCSRRGNKRGGGGGRGGRVLVPGEDHVPQSQVFLIHYYVPEEDTREEEEMDKEDELQLQEKIMFPKCPLSTIMFQKKTPENRRRRWIRRRSSSYRRRSCSPSVHYPILFSRRRHQRRGGNGRGGRVPVPGEGHVPQSQEFLIHYYVPEEDTREKEEMDEEEEFQFQEKIMFPSPKSS